MATAQVGVAGAYHHQRHADAAEKLLKICNTTSDLTLPSTAHLRLPLRSTVDASLIKTGSLHEIAIRSILCHRAHWYQTVKLTLGDFPKDQTTILPIGPKSSIPRSLSPGNVNHGDDDTGVPNNEVAVVGMACRFPQADGLDEFWQLLQDGRSTLGKLPLERYNPAHLSRTPKLADFWGNFLRQPDVFDHRFFGISGREAKSMDPQQRLALQVAYEALESSGYFSQSSGSAETDVGCYFGVGAVEYEENVASDNANAFSALGTLRAFITGRISHYFDWSGPSITFDTACSSSAVAIHTACKVSTGYP